MAKQYDTTKATVLRYSGESVINKMKEIELSDRFGRRYNKIAIMNVVINDIMTVTKKMNGYRMFQAMMVAVQVFR